MSESPDELYQRMCLAADELQERWIPKVGDWGITDFGEVVLIHENTDEKSKANCPLLAYTQSYGMTACIGRDFHEVGNCLFDLDQLWMWYCKEARWDLMIINIARRVSTDIYSHKTLPEPKSLTFEEELLSAIMKRDYQKCWDGEAWVAVN